MTDSSSDAEMVNELLAAKMETARSQTQMTHVMRIGTFHMEIVPTKDIDTVDLFNQTLASYEENTRSKQQCATVLYAFASYIGLKLPEDWRKQGNLRQAQD